MRVLHQRAFWRWISLYRGGISFRRWSWILHLTPR
ncbi:hypothetical protein GCK32_012481 [Trichostrongylus colubriformis]|uniref:Uncharacterized protein n=1 Tax=Trichostrongylus colubriformis TaxID=6319 RepID=A0AAN8FE51_TRICO